MSRTNSYASTELHPPAPAAGGVLICGGFASPVRLADLGTCYGEVAVEDVHILTTDRYEASSGAPALQAFRSAAWEPLHWLPERAGFGVSQVMDAIDQTHATTLVIGYPASLHGRARIAELVMQVRAERGIRVVLYFERSIAPWRRILVPYLHGAADAAAMELASHADADVTLLHAIEPSDEGSEPASVSPAGGTTLRIVASVDPVTAAAEEAQQGYDLVIIGGDSAPHGRAFTVRQRRLLLTTNVSLAIVYPAANPHGVS